MVANKFVEPQTEKDYEDIRQAEHFVGLTDREITFVLAYVENGRNAAAAARAVNPSYTPKSAASRGYEFVKKPHVEKAITAHFNMTFKTRVLTTEMAAAKISAIADHDPGNYYKTVKNKKGDKQVAIPLTELTPEQRCAIKAVKYDNNGNQFYEFHDKYNALKEQRNWLEGRKKKKKANARLPEFNVHTIDIPKAEGAPPIHPKDLRIRTKPGDMNIVLHQAQSKWWDTVATGAQDMLIGGAAGPGKSYWIRAFISYLFVNVPNITIGLFRRLWPELIGNHIQSKSSLMDMLQPWIERGTVTWNASQHFFYNKSNGSYIHLRAFQYDKDWSKIQGLEFDVIVFDEMTTFMQSQIQNIGSRLRSAGDIVELPEKVQQDLPGLKLPLTIGASNPGGVGHHYVKQRYVDFCIEPYKPQVVPFRKVELLRAFCPATLEENPILAVSDPGYEDRLMDMADPDLSNAMRYGDWNILSGGMFGDLWRDAVHKIEPFMLSPSWRLFRSMDWGSDTPSSVQYWAITDGTEGQDKDGLPVWYPARSAILVSEIYTVEVGPDGLPRANKGLKQTARALAKMVREMDEHLEQKYGMTVEGGPADPAIYSRAGTSNESGGLNSIGFEFEDEGVYWVKADATPHSRAPRWELMRQLMKNTHKEKPTDVWEHPVIQVFNTCKHGFLRTVPTAERDPKKPHDINKATEEHACDSAGYALVYGVGLLNQPFVEDWAV